MKNLSIITLAFLVFAATPAAANYCVSQEITISVNEVVRWRVFACEDETEETLYGVPVPPNAGIVEVGPLDPFASFDYGEWSIRGKSVGTTTMQVNWFYAPLNEMGTCTLTIHVVPEDLTPKTTGEEGDDATDSDPVSMFNLEFFFEPVPDLVIDGPLPLIMQRFYSSDLDDANIAMGSLAQNWRHSFEHYLVRSDDVVTVVFDRGQVIRFQQNGSSWDLVKPLEIPFQLQEIGGGHVLMDPTEQRRYGFDGTGRLMTIKDRNDNTLTLTYGNGGAARVPESVSDGNGRTINFTYSPSNFLQLADDGARGMFYTLFANPFPNFILQSNNVFMGETVTYTYDDPATSGPGNLTSIQRGRGNSPVNNVYDSSGRMQSQTDGETNTYTFSRIGNQSTLTLPTTHTRQYTHDAAGQVTEFVNEVLDSISLTYSGDGHRETINTLGSENKSMTWHAPSGRPASRTNEAGDTITYTYDATVGPEGFTYWDRTRIDYRDLTFETYTYDGAGNVLTHTNRGNVTSTFTYNPKGQVLTAESPLNGVTTYTYNADDTLASMTPPSMNTMTFSYDTSKRRTGIQFIDGTARTVLLTPSDAVESFTDENNRTWTYTYDSNGNLDFITEPDFTFRNFTYDGNDRIKTMNDRGTAMYTFGYDDVGNLTSVASASGHSVSYAYDSRGNLVERTDPALRRYTFGYDEGGDLTSIEDPMLNRHTIDRNELGLPTLLTSEEGRTVEFLYDDAGRVETIIDGLGNPTAYVYDGLGLSGITLADGTTSTSIQRNGIGQVTILTDPNNQDWQYLQNNHGLIESFQDPVGRTWSFGYDDRDRVSLVTYPGGMGAQSLTYDGVGHLTERSYSDGNNVFYTYDGTGRITGAGTTFCTWNVEGLGTGCNGIEISLQGILDQIDFIRYQGAATVSYTYDANGDLTGISDWAGGSVDYTYDGNGRVSTIDRSNGITTTYSYDGDGEITSIQDGAIADISLTHDANGNIVTADRSLPFQMMPSGGSLSLSFDAAGQIDTWTYNPMGLPLSDGVNTHEWNLMGQMTEFSDGTDTLTYTYDGFSHLTSADDGTDNIAFTWEFGLAQPVPLKIAQNGIDIGYAIFTPEGELAYVINPLTNTRWFYHFDERGNTTFLSDDAGQVVTAYDYTPYGCFELSGAPVPNPFTFSGQFGAIHDGNSGMTFMGDRVYDCDSGRYMDRYQGSPRLHPNAANPYGYAGNNPMTYGEPTGQGPTEYADAFKNTIDFAGNVGNASGMVANHIEGKAQHAEILVRATTDTFNSADPKAVGGATRAIREKLKQEQYLKLANSKWLKAAGAAGDILSLVNVAIEGVKLHQNLNQINEDFDRTLVNAFAEYDRTVDWAINKYEAKEITLPTMQQWFSRASRQLKMRLFEAGYLNDVNWLLSVWSFAGNSLQEATMSFYDFGDPIENDEHWFEYMLGR